METLAALAALLLGAWPVMAYDSWHVVDVASVICPTPEERNPPVAPNLAEGKQVKCIKDADPFMKCATPADVTDGDKECPSGEYVHGVSLDCSTPTWIDIDLGEAQTVNEVVLYQHTCGAGNRSFCGHQVWTAVGSPKKWTEHPAVSGFSRKISASDDGVSLRFPPLEARYVRVFSSFGLPRPQDRSLWNEVPFIEVEIFNRTQKFPEFTLGIDYTTDMELGAPHVASFLRVDQGAVDIEFSIEDAVGKEVVPKTKVSLQDLSTVSLDPKCKCADVGVPSEVEAKYGKGYGSSCRNWNQEKCGEWFPNALGDHCCQAWCFTDDGDCSDAFYSSVLPDAYVSYAACDSINKDLDSATCIWSQPDKKEDPCKCINIGGLMNGMMKSKFESGYGSSCAAWDAQMCDSWYDKETLGTWCCSTWCYVDKTCPHAQDTFNNGMEGIIFWADVSCEQEATLIQQCPFRAQVVDNTKDNLDACACLDLQIPADVLPDGAPADYGTTCKPHDAEHCTKWFPGADHGMWCCTSWCWVSESCPSAQVSTIWGGHYYSSMSCDPDVEIVKSCAFSDACKCTGDNTGVNTTKFGVDYGKQCGTHDSVGCKQQFSGMSIWQDDGRNDWCCKNWCYVDAACPVAEPSSVDEGLAWSSAVCEPSDKVYKTSDDTCQTQEGCACLGTPAANSPKLTSPILPNDYGVTCQPWDKDEDICDKTGHFKDISCCSTWCWTSELCPEALPSEWFPGSWYSGTGCDQDLEALRSCAWSDSCKCTNDNTGVDTTIFGVDYGKSCEAWDAKSCSRWWGPGTVNVANFWSDDGDNDWCCQHWCYVKDDCPLADGYGESKFPYAYDACDGGDDKTWSVSRCIDKRRLDEEPMPTVTRLLAGRRGGGSGSRRRSGGSYFTPTRRRRSPSQSSRPVAPSQPRRRANPINSGVPRRRSATVPPDSHRRRSTSVGGTSSSAPGTGGATYGYTDANSMKNNFGGRVPQKTSYGYAGANAFKKDDKKRIAMYAAGGAVAGAVVGVGAYHAYQSMYSDNSFLRRRRSAPLEWCSHDGEFLECTECYRIHGTDCTPSSSCYEQGGCNYKLPANVARDEINAAGFIPKLFTPGLVMKFHSITGAGFTKEDICPSPSLGSTSLKPQLFMTLAQQDSLDPDRSPSTPSLISASVLSTGCAQLMPALILVSAFRLWARF